MAPAGERVARGFLMRFLVAVVLTCPWLLQSQNDPEAVRSVSEALRSGDYRAAVASANQALQTDPKNVRLLTLLGLALSKSGRAEDAIASYQKALEVNPVYVPALAGASELEYKSGSDTALKHVNALVELRPADETAHAMRAVIAWKRNDCKGAIKHFSLAQHAIARQPPALQEYGVCLIRLKRTPEAVKVFENLHTLEPDSQPFLLGLVSAQMINKQDAEALATLSPFLKDEHPDPELLRIASGIEERLGNTPEAVALLRRAIILAPDREDLYVDFSSLSFEHKSFQVGIDMIAAGLTRRPNSAKLHLARGVLYAQIGEYDKADDDFAAAERLDPSDAMGRSAQALAQFQSDRLDEALTSVEESLKKQPDDPWLHYLLAEILLRHGAQPVSPDYRRALEAARRAVQLKPDFTLARDVLSRLYLESGDAGAAMRECRLALAADPFDQVALYRLIRALKAKEGGNSREIPALVRQLSEARARSQRQESEANRYKLVEGSIQAAVPSDKN